MKLTITEGGLKLKKWCLIFAILTIALLAISCVPTAPPPETKEPAVSLTGTLKVAVFNDCDADIIDTQILINDKSVKHIPIYNGYWADFGSYEVTNDYKVTIKVIRYHVTSGKKSTEMGKTVSASGSSNIGFWVNEKGISIKEYPEVVPKSVPAKIPEEITITPGKKPEDVIPVSVSGFKFVEKSEFVKTGFEGGEYSAYSFFLPVVGSKFEGKVDSLEVWVYKFKDEISAGVIFAASAGAGTTQEEIQLHGVNAILTYDEDYGDASVVWQEGKLVIVSSTIPPFEATTFDEQVLKDAVLEGAEAVAKKL